MAYQPRLPKTNVNVSRQRPLADLLLIGSALTLLLLLLYWLLGLAVDKAISQLDPKLEYQWFGQWQQHSASSPVQQQLQQLSDQLQQCTALAYPVRVSYLDQPQVNAGVLPGGSMLVYRGLLTQLPTENALAFVLAHELAHLEQRDHLRGLGRGLVLAVLSATLTGNANAGQIFLPATELGIARHSQQRELAADARALAILHCHYGHIGGAERFFQTLAASDSSQLPDWFASHPALQKRLTALQTEQQRHGYPVQAEQPLAEVLQQLSAAESAAEPAQQKAKKPQ